ncbi:hypothetical protein [Mycolicibacterium sp. CR10]|uniref:hypothetical protein n=1 Tax=Mycolicibacterium sp. CR10 TaxID=2562314 RepID=UPI0010BFB50E|nr:hypothetical protein [Mycolicibacterium sp. CR10]
MSTTSNYNRLADCEAALLQARNLARAAAEELPTARATRAAQLVDQIENAIAWVQRISFYCEADGVTR